MKIKSTRFLLANLGNFLILFTAFYFLEEQSPKPIMKIIVRSAAVALFSAFAIVFIEKKWGIKNKENPKN